MPAAHAIDQSRFRRRRGDTVQAREAENDSPGLRRELPSADTRSFALIMEDADASRADAARDAPRQRHGGGASEESGPRFIHWVLYDTPAGVGASGERIRCGRGGVRQLSVYPFQYSMERICPQLHRRPADSAGWAPNPVPDASKSRRVRNGSCLRITKGAVKGATTPAEEHQ